GFWETRRPYDEGRERCRAALCHAGAQAPGRERAAALQAAGSLAYRQTDYAEARDVLEESLRISRRLNDCSGVARALGVLGHLAHGLRDFARARALFEETMAAYREAGDRRGEGISFNYLGVAAEFQG